MKKKQFERITPYIEILRRLSFSFAGWILHNTRKTPNVFSTCIWESEVSENFNLVPGDSFNLFFFQTLIIPNIWFNWLSKCFFSYLYYGRYIKSQIFPINNSSSIGLLLKLFQQMKLILQLIFEPLIAHINRNSDSWLFSKFYCLILSQTEFCFFFKINRKMIDTIKFLS